MAEARQQADWNRTAHLLCLTANVHRDVKKKRNPFRPGDFMPQTGSKPSAEDKPIVGIEVLKAVFVDRHFPPS